MKRKMKNYCIVNNLKISVILKHSTVTLKSMAYTYFLNVFLFNISVCQL